MSEPLKMIIDAPFIDDIIKESNYPIELVVLAGVEFLLSTIEGQEDAGHWLFEYMSDSEYCGVLPINTCECYRPDCPRCKETFEVMSVCDTAISEVLAKEKELTQYRQPNTYVSLVERLDDKALLLEVHHNEEE